MMLTITVIAGYLLGSIPFGYLLVKAKTGKDIRKVGSGSIGATNISRVLGGKYFGVVSLFDVLKGAFAAILGELLLGSAQGQLIGGLCAVLGHVFPVWLALKGGKGVNTSLGIALVMEPLGAVIALVCFLIVYKLSKFISLSSMTAGLVYFIYVALIRAYIFGAPSSASFLFSLFLPLILIITHRENIARLIKGQENPFGKTRDNDDKQSR